MLPSKEEWELFMSSLGVSNNDIIIIYDDSHLISSCRCWYTFLYFGHNQNSVFVLDGGWGPCGISSEIISSAVENVEPKFFKSKPARLTLPFTPAPTSKVLEKEYYPTEKKILNKILKIFENNL